MQRPQTQRPVHPGRRFIDPVGTPQTTSFSESLLAIQHSFGSSAEQLGNTFTKSLESVTGIFTPETAGHQVSTATYAKLPPGPFVPEVKSSHGLVHAQEFSASFNQSMGSFKQFSGSIRDPHRESRKSPEPMPMERPKSWEDAQRDLALLRKQAKEGPQKPEEHRLATRSVIKETEKIQEQMRSPEVREALERRKKEANLRSQFESEAKLHNDGLSYQIKFGPLKGTKTYNRRKETASEELGG
eukprot:3634698-Rhodomonas_salina.1